MKRKGREGKAIFQGSYLIKALKNGFIPFKVNVNSVH
jgi:hypothetical protein